MNRALQPILWFFVTASMLAAVTSLALEMAI